MSEMSMLLKVDKSGRLFMLDLKMENGKVVIPSMEWEEAVDYACTLEVINDLFSEMMDRFQ